MPVAWYCKQAGPQPSCMQTRQILAMQTIDIDPGCANHTRQTARTLVCCAEEEELARAEEQQTVLMVEPTDNDDVTDVLQMLEQELAAYEEQELTALGGGRGGGRGGRGGGARASAARLEMEDLVDLAQEAARARCSGSTACCDKPAAVYVPV